MTADRFAGRPYDPDRPRILKRVQADDARFYEALGTLTIRGIESLFNNGTGYLCRGCGSTTYGQGVDECGRCQRKRGAR